MKIIIVMGGRISRSEINEFSTFENYVHQKGEFNTLEGWESFIASMRKDFTLKEQKKLIDFIKFQFQGKIPLDASADKISLYKIMNQTRMSKKEEPAQESNPEAASKTQNINFINWGETVRSKLKAFYPESKAELVEFMKEMLSDPNFKVRASGFRHSFSNVFSNEGRHLVSLIPEWVASGTSESLLKFLKMPIIQTSEFYEIKLVGTHEGKPLVRMGGGVTNEQLRQWSQQNPYAMPLNVIMVEITVSGSNGTMSHGAGIKTKTLSDLVFEIEFVNAKGNLQKLNKLHNPDLMGTAAGALGMLGIVVSLTLELVPQQIAQFSPKLQRAEKAIPMPQAEETPEHRTNVQAFNDICSKKYYAEWFWFIDKKDVYINSWDLAPLSNTVKLQKVFPSKSQVKLQSLMSGIVDGLQDSILENQLHKHRHFRKALTKGFSTMALATLPHEPINTYLSEALHFQRGIQNFTIRNFEVEIEIPLHNGQLDFDICRKAWWEAVKIIQADADLGINLTLEMRIFGGSNITMAPEYGHAATCSIEVLSNMVVPEKYWRTVASKIWQAWSWITDKYGNPLKVCPHWAKEWEFLTNQDGSPILYTLKANLHNQIQKFKQDLEKIGSLPENPADRWTAQEARQRFSNVLFDKLIFD